MINTKFFPKLYEFIGDPVIYRTSDEWGDILVIRDRNYRQLIFGSPNEQSRMDMRNPHILVHKYTRAMMIVLAFIKPQHVTLLGLGGGCLLRSMFHIMPTCELHVVELRQRVYDIASGFFGLPISDNVTITIDDAKKQLENTRNNNTNIIFSDMYGSVDMNSYQLEIDFLNQCYRILSLDGWLVINYLEISNYNTPFFDHLCDLFSSVFICDVPDGNTIIFACKSRIGELNQFNCDVVELEKRLEVKLTQKLKRMTRLMLCGNYR